MATSVLVLGAGFGGLELSTACPTRSATVEVTLIDRSDAFVFGFSKLDVMFGRRAPDAVRLPYGDITTPRVRFRQETDHGDRPGRAPGRDRPGRVRRRLPGGRARRRLRLAATPGLAEAGNEFYSVAGAVTLRDVLPTFRAGNAIVGVCGAPFKCPPAPSEAALLLDDFLRERGVRDDVTIKVVIPFGAPIPPSPDDVPGDPGRFAERGIEFVPSRRVASLDPATREAVLSDGARLPFDLFLGIPVHRAPAVVEESGLTDDGGIPVDPRTLATGSPACTRWAT